MLIGTSPTDPILHLEDALEAQSSIFKELMLDASVDENDPRLRMCIRHGLLIGATIQRIKGDTNSLILMQDNESVQDRELLVETQSSEEVSTVKAYGVGRKTVEVLIIGFAEDKPALRLGNVLAEIYGARWREMVDEMALRKGLAEAFKSLELYSTQVPGASSAVEKLFKVLCKERGYKLSQIAKVLSDNWGVKLE